MEHYSIKEQQNIDIESVKRVAAKVETMLTPDQHEHWEYHLEKAERAREYALRMLGRLGVEERGLDG